MVTSVELDYSYFFCETHKLMLKVDSVILIQHTTCQIHRIAPPADSFSVFPHKTPVSVHSPGAVNGKQT